jgi:integrase
MDITSFQGTSMTHHRDLRLVNLQTLQLQPQRWRYVLSVILVQHNWRHATKDKNVSRETMEDRRQFLFRTFEFLRRNSLKSFKLDPRSFSGRHVEFLFQHYECRAREGTLGASTLQKYHSNLSTFASWIGKPALVKPIGAYISEPTLYSRRYVATESKTWRSHGVDAGSVVDAIAACDEHAAAAVELMHRFGFRFKEAVMFRPHVDVVTAAQAGVSSGEATHYIRLHRGTKGGRLRHVAVDTPERIAAIERARRVAVGENDSISDPKRTLVQAISHLRYVMAKFGLTKHGLGVTPHGLRHQYAADEYRDLTGEAPPVEGGPAPPHALALQARTEISKQLGHARLQITNAYIGSIRRPSGKSGDNVG